MVILMVQDCACCFSVLSVCHLSVVCNECIVAKQYVLLKNVWRSKWGCSAASFGCDGNFNDSLVANCLQSGPVEKFWKSVDKVTFLRHSVNIFCPTVLLYKLLELLSYYVLICIIKQESLLCAKPWNMFEILERAFFVQEFVFSWHNWKYFSLFRWIKDGRVPYTQAVDLLPDDMHFSIEDRDTFRTKVCTVLFPIE